MVQQFDVAVIGGGISGCSAAWHLARRGRRVALFEQGEIAQEQSQWAWGYVRCQGRHPAEVPLAQAAAQEWSRLAGELQADLEYVRRGILAIGETNADEDLLRAGARIAGECGIESRLVDRNQIRDLIPQLDGPWRIGLYTPEDGHAEPIKATRAFAEAATRLGAVIHTRTAVQDVIVRDGKVSGLRTTSGDILADRILCTAGLNGANFARRLGVTIPVRGVRSTVIETNPSPKRLTDIAVWGPYVAFRPTQRNTFYLGNGYRGAGADFDITIGALHGLRYFLPNYVRNARRLDLKLGPEFLVDLRDRVTALFRPREVAPARRIPRLNHVKVRHNERRFYELMPSLDGLGIQRSWAGRVDLTPDAIPAIGPLRTVKGFIVATGFSGHGFALGPITGRILAELASDEDLSMDISAFEPHRFEDGRVAAFKEAL